MTMIIIIKIPIIYNHHNNDLHGHLGFGLEVIRLRRVAKDGSCWLLGGPAEIIMIIDIMMIMMIKRITIMIMMINIMIMMMMITIMMNH